MCCLIKGASGAPNLAPPLNVEVPNIAGSFVCKETSKGCILSEVSKSNLTLSVASVAPYGLKDTLTWSKVFKVPKSP